MPRLRARKMICAAASALILGGVAACTAPVLSITPATPTRALAISPTPSRDLNSQDLGGVVQIIAYAREDRGDAGKSAAVRVRFELNNMRITRRSDGTISETSLTPLKNAKVTEMKFCYAVEVLCDLPNNWVPFVEEQTLNIETDWVGTRELQLRAQFRDATGAIIPALSSSSFELPQATAQQSARITTVLNERTPLAAAPAKIQTLVVATRSAFPVTGFTRFENNRTMAGGKAGTTIDVKVIFGASSPFGEVKEMRVRDFRARKCANQEEMNQAPWEPFASEKVFKINVVVNFTSFDVSAQYRDAKGNLSPIYCADMAIEGMP